MKINIERTDSDEKIFQHLSDKASAKFDNKVFSRDLDDIFRKCWSLYKLCKSEIDRFALPTSLLNNVGRDLEIINKDTRLRSLSVKMVLEPILYDFSIPEMVTYNKEVRFALSSLNLESFYKSVKPEILKLSSINFALTITLDSLRKLVKPYNQYSSITNRLDNLEAKLDDPELTNENRNLIALEQEKLNKDLNNLDTYINDIKKAISIATKDIQSVCNEDDCIELQELTALLFKFYRFRFDIHDDRVIEMQEARLRAKRKKSFFASSAILIFLVSSIYTYDLYLKKTEKQEFAALINNPLITHYLGRDEIESLKRTKSAKALKKKILLHEKSRTKPLINLIQKRIIEVESLTGQYFNGFRSVNISINLNALAILKREFGSIDLKLVPKKEGIPDFVKFDGNTVTVEDVCKLESLNMDLLVSLDFGLNIKFSFKIDQELRVLLNNPDSKSICD